MTDGSPKEVPIAVDLHEHLVQMPAPFARFHTGNTSFPDLRGKHRAEPMPPESHSLMTDIDAAFVQKILDIAKGKWEPHIQHHCQADNLTARFEIAKWIRFGHPERLRNHPARLKSVSSDKAAPTNASGVLMRREYPLPRGLSR